jgi:LIVCS family branched-chain amino acid:cation transporter
MKLTKGQMVTVSFMLFSLFFGAGNLIFPPFLGQNAAHNTLPAILGFLITAVLLPVLGVVVVAQSEGLDKLGARVNGKFAIVFTVLIYLSIGPGLGIPRAASVPFEMAVAPYLPEGTSLSLFMLVYSLVFFAIAAWLAFNPSKLVDRIGRFLTPTLLTLIVFLFISLSPR